MLKNLLVAVVLSFGTASMAFAAGSTSTSTPPTKPGDYDVAVKAVKAGDFTRALGLLQKVVKKNPRNANAWNFVGFSQRNLGRFDDALAAYRKALAIDPRHRGANEYLGELYLKTGDLEKAKERLKKLDELCTFGCEEFDDLKAAITAYEAGRKSG